MDFVHLHINTEYSLLKSAAKIDGLVQRAKELGYRALAITDQNVMYGVIPFYKACVKAGIKPIIGLELSIEGEDNQESKILLLAKTNLGYKNLIKLSSIAQILPASSVKKIERKHLFRYASDLILISSPYKGEIHQLLEINREKAALNKVMEYKKYFGNDVYLGIQDHQLASEKEMIRKIIQFAKRHQLPLVASNQVMYVNKADAKAHECLLAIEKGVTIKELDNEFQPNQYYLKSKEEMVQLFSYVPEALENTNEIAAACVVDIRTGTQSLPKYPLPEGENPKAYLAKICNENVQKRYQEVTTEIRERLQYELKVIDQMNFNDYFLIVWDFMKFAHENNMIVGPGRGSAAGSLVAYVLNITNVDPIKYDLLFERFLNPERISMPDIDIDFPDTRREEVIQYVYHKYGKNHVAQIITFGTLAAKAALRDVGKVIGIPLKQIDMIAKQISSRPNLTIADALAQTPFLQEKYNSEIEIKNWIELAKKVEGIPRHASTHAAGIVISETALTEKVPLQKGHTDVLLTQYPMNVLEEVGLLKMDFLGLRNLSFMEEILHHIQTLEGTAVHLEEISYADEKTYKLLGEGDTTGIFQLESPGMQRVLANLKPTEFEDIVAVNALYRPGPMENIPLYIAGKHKKRLVEFLHPDLKPILEKTYGVIIYQEQIMQIASKMAGFSLGEADILRRAVSKKNRETLEEQREKFVQGGIRRNYDEAVVQAVYDLIVRFANYGFNRSHSVAYSVISYQLSFLKANYPTAFYAALLTSAIGMPQKVNQYIVDASRKKINIAIPSINSCNAQFTIKNKSTINFGLAAIKNVGVKVVEEIVKERIANGNYTDFFDFCARIKSKFFNRRTMEALVCAGCFDEFGHHRASLLATIDDALHYGEKVNEALDNKQTTLFVEEIPKPKFVQVPPFIEIEKLYLEKEVLGFYLSSHPIKIYLSTLNSQGRTPIAEALESKNEIRIGGLIESVRKIKTKKGEQMAFLKISDETQEIDVTAFPQPYREFFSVLKEGELVFLQGRLEISEQRKQLIVEKAMLAKDIQKREDKATLYLKIEEHLHDQNTLTELKKALKKFPGKVKVILYYVNKKQTVQLSDDYGVSASDQCLAALFQLIGKENVALKR